MTSDLHVGDGGPLDNFAHEALFDSWLDNIASPGAVLVLNGDVIDFAQIKPLKIDSEVPANLLWTEETSMEKLENAISAHPGFFVALRNFHSAGGEIRIVVGNHDLDMAWTAVRARIASCIEATSSDRLVFELMGTEYDGVVIQHGHQATPENAVLDPTSFVHVGPDGQQYLERVWGTDFVVNFFNEIHTEFEFATNVKPPVQVLFHAVLNRWIRWHHLVRAVAFLKQAGVPWRAVGEKVLRPQVGESGVDLELLAEEIADPYLAGIVEQYIDSLPPEMIAGTLPPGTLDEWLTSAMELSQQVAVKAEEGGFGQESTSDGEPTAGMIRDRRELREARRLVNDGARHVVLGHTHSIVDGELISDASDAKLYNPGTWIPFLDLRDPEIAARRYQTGLTKELLNDRNAYTTEIHAVKISDDGSEPTLVRLDVPSD